MPLWLHLKLTWHGTKTVEEKKCFIDYYFDSTSSQLRRGLTSLWEVGIQIPLNGKPMILSGTTGKPVA